MIDLRITRPDARALLADLDKIVGEIDNDGSRALVRWVRLRDQLQEKLA